MHTYTFNYTTYTYPRVFKLVANYFEIDILITQCEISQHCNCNFLPSDWTKCSRCFRMNYSWYSDDPRPPRSQSCYWGLFLFSAFRVVKSKTLRLDWRATWQKNCALIGPSLCQSLEGVFRQELVAKKSLLDRGEAAATGKCLQCLMGRNWSGAPAAFAWCRRTEPLTAPSPWTSRSGSQTKRWDSEAPTHAALLEAS